MGGGPVHHILFLLLGKSLTAIFPRLDFRQNGADCAGVDLSVSNDGFGLSLCHNIFPFSPAIISAGGRISGGRPAGRFDLDFLEEYIGDAGDLKGHALNGAVIIQLAMLHDVSRDLDNVRCA